jgi:hypothetical protein
MPRFAAVSKIGLRYEAWGIAMATATYESALELARSLSSQEQLRLIHELSVQSTQFEETPKKRSVLDLCGLGAEIWEGIDAQKYVNEERSSWGG